MISFRSLYKYAPIFLLIIVMIATTNSILPAEAQVPSWINPKNSCIVFQMVYNRTYWNPNTEIGQTTDFNEPYECVRWCQWVQACIAILFVEVIDTAYGGCYDIQGPCCKLYSLVTPDWQPIAGVPYHPGHQHTAIMRFLPPPFPYDTTCDPVKYVIDMEPVVGLPYIWYDSYYGLDNLVVSNNTLPEESMSTQESMSAAQDTTSSWHSPSHEDA
jgi:hypothetical protein